MNLDFACSSLRVTTGKTNACSPWTSCCVCIKRKLLCKSLCSSSCYIVTCFFKNFDFSFIEQTPHNREIKLDHILQNMNQGANPRKILKIFKFLKNCFLIKLNIENSYFNHQLSLKQEKICFFRLFLRTVYGKFA